jgi:hypothetical protein|tara:strand:+ start:2797 stop:3150 length:354 start_codon:yes stop_codon:yes gene_type:complete
MDDTGKPTPEQADPNPEHLQEQKAPEGNGHDGPQQAADDHARAVNQQVNAVFQHLRNADDVVVKVIGGSMIHGRFSMIVEGLVILQDGRGLPIVIPIANVLSLGAGAIIKPTGIKLG